MGLIENYRNKRNEYNKYLSYLVEIKKTLTYKEWLDRYSKITVRKDKELNRLLKRVV